VSGVLSVDVIVSNTEAASSAGPELIGLCERAVRETLEREAGRLAGIAGDGPNGVSAEGGAPNGVSAEGGAPSGGEGAVRHGVEVSLTLTGDPGIRDLNRRYLDRDRPTDVMAFPMSVWEGLSFVLGDVVVSVDTARLQARDWNRPFPEELTRLVIHGTLHLLGYTDESEDSAALMHSKEDDVLGALGFSPRRR